MDRAGLKRILDRLPQVSIAVIGDFFLDRYFVLDSELSEVSIETGLTAYQAVDRRLSPGAAGTVVSNLRVLGVGQVLCLGVIGMDGEGFELKRGLEKIGADSSWLIECEDRFTPCYTKPMLLENGSERELERIDIKNRSAMATEVEDELIDLLRKALESVDAVIIADQAQERNCGVITDRVRQAIADLAPDYPDKVFFVDSRVRIGEFRNVIIKPNKFEAVAAVRGEVVGEPTPEEAAACAQELHKLTGKPVFMTAQEDGIVIFNNGVSRVPALRVEGEIDPCGAGDSCTSGIVSALCAGTSLEDAALMGNIVASITVRKIGQTGTASPDDILARFDEAGLERDTA